MATAIDRQGQKRKRPVDVLSERERDIISEREKFIISSISKNVSFTRLTIRKIVTAHTGHVKRKIILFIGKPRGRSCENVRSIKPLFLVSSYFRYFHPKI